MIASVYSHLENMAQKIVTFALRSLAFFRMRDFSSKTLEEGSST